MFTYNNTVDWISDFIDRQSTPTELELSLLELTEFEATKDGFYFVKSCLA